jgi:hypothetical protein
MIEERIEKIEAQVRAAGTMPAETKSELLGLLAALKTEIAALPEAHQEDARSIAGFADASAHEAIRAERKPLLVDAAVRGLTYSVKGFEATHPNLTQVVNRIAFILSNMGI